MKFAIGTAQFGMDYGVTNRDGKVSASEIKNILNLASSSGLDTLDTAAAYGDSEIVLGKSCVVGWKVVTKLPCHQENIICNQSWLTQNLQYSLDRLRARNVYGLLIHRSNQITKENAAALGDAVNKAKASGKISKFGVSIYSPNELDDIYDLIPIDLVQSPLNAFDRRLLQSGWLDKLNKDGVEVHARSAYLQGLLLMEPKHLPERFKRWQNLFERWRSWVNESAVDPVNACLSYLNDKRIHRVVIGVDDQRQLLHALSATEQPFVDNLPDFSCRDKALIDPKEW